MSIYTHKLTSESFAKIFDEKENNLPLIVKQAIEKTNFRYRIVENKEYENAILRILKTLDSKTLKISGSHRINDWEKGWEEHLKDFNKSNYDVNLLIAKFATTGMYVRFQGDLIKPESNSFESDFVAVIRCYLFTKYLKKANAFYEFGAGTGVNLVAVAEVFPQLKLTGLDWAQSSVDLINTLKEKLYINVTGKKLDMFNPDKKYQLDKDSSVLTIGALEQLGENFKPFINYLLKNNPQVCIHLETIYEMYDQNNLLDYLAAKYLKKRNYLRGFLPYLKKLESKKKIKIFEIRRTFGSLYHEGYTYIVWKPLPAGRQEYS